MVEINDILIIYQILMGVDNIEAKENNKKSIDNSLDWFLKSLRLKDIRKMQKFSAFFCFSLDK